MGTKLARKNSEANLENTPASIAAIFDKHKPQAPLLKEYWSARQAAHDAARRAMIDLTEYLEALTKVQADLKVLKVSQQDVVARNDYKRIIESKIRVYSGILKNATELYEYIAMH